MPDVKTPFGKVPKPAVYIAILAGGGALIYSYVKKKNAASKAAATTANMTAGTYGYGSGAYGYGGGQYGYGAYTYEPYGYGYGPMGLGAYGGQGDYGYGYYGAGVPYQVQGQATTNAQWAQAAVSALTQGGQYSATTVLAALGLYLTGGHLSSDQEIIVQSAIAAEGYPPIPGSNGYPPAINTSAAGGQTGTGGGGNNVTVPGVTGDNWGMAYNHIKAAGLVPAIKGASSIAHVNTSRKVTAQTPASGASVAPGSTVTVTLSK
jgi:hypothetical protein